MQMADDVLEFPHSKSGKANLLDFVTRKQRRVVRSTFSAELNGLVDSIESMLLLQATLHQVYCGHKETTINCITCKQRQSRLKTRHLAVHKRN